MTSCFEVVRLLLRSRAVVPSYCHVMSLLSLLSMSLEHKMDSQQLDNWTVTFLELCLTPRRVGRREPSLVET